MNKCFKEYSIFYYIDYVLLFTGDKEMTEGVQDTHVLNNNCFNRIFTEEEFKLHLFLDTPKCLCFYWSDTEKCLQQNYWLMFVIQHLKETFSRTVYTWYEDIKMLMFFYRSYTEKMFLTYHYDE